MLRVPNALIRNICYPTSYRLPKQHVMQFPVPIPATKAPLTPYQQSQAAMVAVSRTSGSVSFYPDRNSLSVAKQEAIWGNLNNEEYSQFRGYPVAASLIGKCRWCDAVLSGLPDRKRHVLMTDCKIKLAELYKKLRKDKSCLICDRHTKKITWGIPLCSKSCETAWRFTIPGAFTFERNVVKAYEERRVLDGSVD